MHLSKYKVKMKLTKKWNFEEIEQNFGLQRVPKAATLTNWLSANWDFTETEIWLIKRLHKKLELYVDAWQEDELKSFFIIPFIEIIDFEKFKLYKSFTQRVLAAKIKNTKNEDVLLRGRVEFLVSSGMITPRQPFFFLHEYKQQEGTNPLGQLLAAMLVAQTMNSPQQTLYGVYVIGRMWFFVTLQGNDYAVSKAFDCTDENTMLKVGSILKECKKYIDDFFTA